MSLQLDDVLAALRDGNYITDPKALQSVAKDLIALEKENKEAKADAGPKAKTRLAVLIRGDAALKTAVAGGAFIVSVPDDSTTNTYSSNALLDRIRKAVTAHNEIPRKRKSKTRGKIETWMQAFTQLKAKTIKGSGSQIGIKGKGNPVEVVILEKETVQ